MDDDSSFSTASRFFDAVMVLIGRSCRGLWRCAVFAAGFHLLMSDPVIYGQTTGANVRVAQTAPGRRDSPQASIQAPQPQTQPGPQAGHSSIQPVQFQNTNPAQNRIRSANSSRPISPGIGPVYSEWRRDNRPAVGTMQPANSGSATRSAQGAVPHQISVSPYGVQAAAFQMISSGESAPLAHSNSVMIPQPAGTQHRVFEPQNGPRSAMQSEPPAAPPIHVYPPGFATREPENTIVAPQLKPIPQPVESAIPLLTPPGLAHSQPPDSISTPAMTRAPMPGAAAPDGLNIGNPQSAPRREQRSSLGGWSLPNADPQRSAPGGFTQTVQKRSAPVHVYPEGVTLQEQPDSRSAAAFSSAPTDRPLHVYPEHHSAAVENRQRQSANPSFQTHSLQAEPPSSASAEPRSLREHGMQPQGPQATAGHALSRSPLSGPATESHLSLSPERYRPPTAILPTSQRPDSKPTTTVQQVSAESSAADSEIFWWEQDLARQLLRGRQPYTLSLPQALGLALTEAPELQILHSDWFIQQIEVTRRDGQFDWTTFVDSIWNRDSTPVGSNLDGAAERLRSRSLNAAAGIRRLGRDGTELEVFQRFGLLGSNSQFINPNNQGTTRLGFNYEKPLMRGGGTDFNEGPVRLAQIDNDVAFDRFQIGIQDHLLAVSSAYWSLVLQRGLFLQAVNSWTRAGNIANEMAGRVEIDVTPNMLDRARSEVAVRLAAAIQAEHDTVQAQDTLLRLIFGSKYTDIASNEVVTLTLPMAEADQVAPEAQIQTALHQRSEIHESIRQIKAAALRHNLAANEVMPMLNLVLTGYVAGLERNSNIGQSFLNQFDRGEPGVGVGLNFEVPYRNRAAQAAAEQSLIAIKRMRAQLELTIGEVTEDVRGQVIQRNKYGAMLTQQWESLARAKRILKYAETRRSVLADGTAVADLYLENLLLMQNRLADAEQAYLQSQVLFSLADNALLRALSRLDSLAERELQPAAHHSMPTPELQHFPME